MKAFSFKNGNVVVRYNVNNVMRFMVLLDDGSGNLVETIEDITTYAEAKQIATEGRP